MSVCGTGAAWVKLSGFSREYDYPHYQIPPRRTPYYQVQLKGWICLPLSTPTLFNGDFRRPAVVSLLRLHVAPCDSDGILTVSAIAIFPAIATVTMFVSYFITQKLSGMDAQMQDWLELGEGSRINTPGTGRDNWQWRLLPGELTVDLISGIREMTRIYGRLPAKQSKT